MMKNKENSWTIEKALSLSAHNSVEWRLYEGNGVYVSLPELEQRINYLENQLQTRYQSYCNALLPFLKTELWKRKSQQFLLLV